jgi:hypothetical protein
VVGLADTASDVAAALEALAGEVAPGRGGRAGSVGRSGARTRTPGRAVAVRCGRRGVARHRGRRVAHRRGRARPSAADGCPIHSNRADRCAIGQGPPSALGAAVAAPDRPVVAVQADGSALYSLQALGPRLVSGSTCDRGDQQLGVRDLADGVGAARSRGGGPLGACRADADPGRPDGGPGGGMAEAALSSALVRVADGSPDVTPRDKAVTGVDVTGCVRDSGQGRQKPRRAALSCTSRAEPSRWQIRREIHDPQPSARATAEPGRPLSRCTGNPRTGNVRGPGAEAFQEHASDRAPRAAASG